MGLTQSSTEPAVAQSGPVGSGVKSAPQVPGEVRRLGILFGTIYFIQGIGDPNDGLITQPVLSLLKWWGCKANEIAGFAALLGLPWSLKPLYGLLTDFVPILGY